MRLPANDRPECIDASADGLRMGVPAWDRSRKPHTIWLSGTVLSVERNREIHCMCKGLRLLSIGFF